MVTQAPLWLNNIRPCWQQSLYLSRPAKSFFSICLQTRAFYLPSSTTSRLGLCPSLQLPVILSSILFPFQGRTAVDIFAVWARVLSSTKKACFRSSTRHLLAVWTKSPSLFQVCCSRSLGRPGFSFLGWSANDDRVTHGNLSEVVSLLLELDMPNA